MPPKNLICVVVDRLHAGMLGAYGNSWIHTEHLDELACQSFLFDQAYLDCPQLERLYRAYWLGLHAAGDCEQTRTAPSLLQVLRSGGWHTALITDETEVAGMPPAADFAESVLMESLEAVATANDPSESGMARLFGAATAWLQAAPQPFCLWLHARGMGAAWDAPMVLRNQYADEEDPPPPEFVEVPNRWLADDYDPDELLGVTHAYAGQVSLLDMCLGALLDQLQQTGLNASTQLTLLGARGFPLGEHLRIGVCDEALYNETAQVPWLMRFHDGLGKLRAAKRWCSRPTYRARCWIGSSSIAVRWAGLRRRACCRSFATKSRRFAISPR